MSETASPRPLALITGASAGIGTAFARELARRGHDLLLTARREDRLRALADELAKAHGTRSWCLPLDLADPAAPQALFDYAKAQGLSVDVLVNNAGYGVTGTLESQPWRKHADFIEVLMTAPVALSYLFLPGMQARGRGCIMNIASLAGHVPGSAGHTLYAGSKAFLIKFSQSLALENRAKGVKVCAVCPGFTYSEFHDVTGARAQVSKMPKWMWMTAEEVAIDGIDAAFRGDVVRVNGRVNRLIKTFVSLLPDTWALALIQRRSKDFRIIER